MKKIPPELQRKWIKEENERLAEGKKKYLHFDFRIGKLNNTITASIFSPNHVVRHSFYPLIQRSKSWRRYKKDKSTGKKIIEEKIRPISYAAHYDSIVYSWYGYVLSYFYETEVKKIGLSENIIGYRKLNKSNVDFSKDAIEFIQKEGRCGVFCVDIEKFFDTIDHKLLKKKWELLLDVNHLPADHYVVYKNITRSISIDFDVLCNILKIRKNNYKNLKRFCEPSVFREIRHNIKGILNKKSRGIPQGSTMSTTLANVYMLDFDKEIAKFAKSISGLYRRYSDDIIIVCPEENLEQTEEKLDTEIKKARLNLNKDKTEKMLFKDSKFVTCNNQKETVLQYLGICFDGHRIMLRHSGIANFQRKMARGIEKLAEKSKRKGRAFPKKSMLRRFFSKRKSNYLSYANRAGDNLKSSHIKKQIAPYKVMRRIKYNLKKFM